MTNAVPILAALVVAVTVTMRARRWPNPESRPLTLGLALLGWWALLRTPALNRWAEERIDSAIGLELLPDVVASAAYVAGGTLIVISIAQAWCKPGLIRAAYTMLVIAEAAILITYDPNEPDATLVDAHKWVLGVIAVAVNAAILVAAAISYRTVPERFRTPIAIFMVGGALGLIFGVVRLVTLLLPEVHLGDYKGLIGGIPVLAYAIAALLGTARAGAADDPAAEIDEYPLDLED
ncbi:hypothetical protein [Nocardia sp. IFM 10818]